MKSKVVSAVSIALLFGLSVSCGKGKGRGSDGSQGMTAQALSGDATIDQMSSSSALITEKELYVPANSNVVTDIDVDHSKLLSCELHLPTTENQTAAHWIPAGTSFQVYKAKIGGDRSFALAIEPGDEPFESSRLSCWAIKEAKDPITISFVRDALAGTFSIDARQ